MTQLSDLETIFPFGTRFSSLLGGIRTASSLELLLPNLEAINTLPCTLFDVL